MVSLLELPTENIAEIASYLRPQGIRPLYRPWPNIVDPMNVPVNLIRLCQTCTLLRDIIQPMIFRSIHIHHKNTGNESTFASLAQTLTCRPFLAEKVSNLLLTSSESGQCEPDEDSVWAAQLPKLATPMLALLSNVTCLHFHCSRFVPVHSPSHLGRLLLTKPSATGETYLLPQLRALYISPLDGTEDFVRIADFVPFFGHPQLDRINIYAGVLLDSIDSWGLDKAHQVLPSSLRISELNLLGCLLDKKTLRMLIEACSGLKSLTYSQLDNDVHDVEEGLEMELHDETTRNQFVQQPLLNPATFSSVLGSCKDTLESLQTSFRRLDGGPMGANFKFSGLQTLNHLVSLNMDASYMSSFQALPSTLEYLTVRIRSMKALPSDLAEFVQETANPRKTQWLSLISVHFDIAFEKARWQTSDVFHQAVSIGKWINHGPWEDPCCFVWRSGDINFTVRNPMLHRKKISRWTIMLDEDKM